MTIDEVIRRLKLDATVPSRFPVRLIFIESLVEYQKLVEQLNNITDNTAIINIGDCCPGDDKYPAQSILDSKIAEAVDTVVLLSISEYLRIGIERELGTQKLFMTLWEGQQSESSLRRIIIPLFSARDLFDRLVPKIDPRQIDCIFMVDGKSLQRYDLSFCAPCFESIFKNATFGVKAWLLNWDKLLASKAQQKIITTLLSRIQKNASAVFVDKLDDIFTYLKNITNETSLIQQWGTDEQWTILAKAHTDATELGSTIDSILRVSKFEPIIVLSRWKTMTADERWLTWLRFHLTNINGFIAHVFRTSKSINAIERDLQFGIFDLLGEHPEWIEEYRAVKTALNPSTTSEFISRLESIEFDEMKLSLLTCGNHEERAYAIKIASEMIRKGNNLKSVGKIFESLYPDFAFYLSSADKLPVELRNYFAWYIQKKVENRYENGEGLVSAINLEKYNSRNSAITKMLPADDAFLFWYDGMGVEWLPLFMHFLDKELETIDASHVSEVCSARIPTETEYNEQWKKYLPNADKLDKLDKLAHNGVPDDNDYYSCIATQIEIVRDFAQFAVSKLKSFNMVIVSADHGSSRMAALAFHLTAGIAAQGGAVLGSHGRYCEYMTMPDMHVKPECAEYDWRDDGGVKKHFFVMTTHDHFSQRGRAVSGMVGGEVGCGEIHGGKTPEEFLIPVIVLKRKVPIVKETPKKSGILRSATGDI